MDDIKKSKLEEILIAIVYSIPTDKEFRKTDRDRIMRLIDEL